MCKTRDFELPGDGAVFLLLTIRRYCLSHKAQWNPFEVVESIVVRLTRVYELRQVWCRARSAFGLEKQATQSTKLWHSFLHVFDDRAPMRQEGVLSSTELRQCHEGRDLKKTFVFLALYQTFVFLLQGTQRENECKRGCETLASGILHAVLYFLWGSLREHWPKKCTRYALVKAPSHMHRHVEKE